MFVFLSANIISIDCGYAGRIGCLLSRSPKEQVDCAKHAVTEDLMVAACAAVHWQT